MKLLIIGGTRFLGRHIVDYSLRKGHEITLFHRGTTNKGLFDVEEILGDRDGQIKLLAGRSWDAVIDTCGYFPRVVEQSAELLADAVHTYCFISSISVYRDGQPGPDEGGEVIRFDATPEKEEITGETYGGFKALCEDEVTRALGPSRTLMIRPGLIVGPHDPSDRFTYWVDRFSSADSILVPDRAGERVQFIDARDLAAFSVDLAASGNSGTFNATGPEKPMTIGQVWEACRANCGGRPSEVLVGKEFLKEEGLQDWSDLPLLVPDGELMDVNCTKAFAAGLKLRSVNETVKDTAAWHRGRGAVEMKAGLSPGREAELLSKWRRQKQKSKNPTTSST